MQYIGVGCISCEDAVELLVRRLLVKEDPHEHAAGMLQQTQTFFAYRLHIAEDTEILRIPVAKYESALNLACILLKHDKEVSDQEKDSLQKFCDRRIRTPGFPKIAHASQVKVFKRHYAPGEAFESVEISACDMLICCHAEALPQWAREKHILAESAGSTIGTIAPTSHCGVPASLLTYVGLRK